MTYIPKVYPQRAAVTGTSYDCDVEDDVVRVNNDSNPVSINLECGCGARVARRVIKNIGSQTATVYPYGSETIDGESSWSLNQGDSIAIYPVESVGWEIE